MIKIIGISTNLCIWNRLKSYGRQFQLNHLMQFVVDQNVFHQSRNEIILEFSRACFGWNVYLLNISPLSCSAWFKFQNIMTNFTIIWIWIQARLINSITWWIIWLRWYFCTIEYQIPLCYLSCKWGKLMNEKNRKFT